MLQTGVVLTLVTCPGSSLELAGAAEAQAPRPIAAVAADTLASPPVLKNLSRTPGTVEVTLSAAPARLALMPGAVTNAYAYNGSVPGPTLEVHEGDRVIIHFHNDLPEPTTIHWHGLHIPSDMDGSPLRPIAPGGHYNYTFTIKPGTAGTYWYHPHPDTRTGFQIAKGLFGAIIVRAADDPLPASLSERLLILSDNRFGADGSVDLPDPLSAQGQLDQENGREGNVLFVNGQVAPQVSIRSGEVQRWRVINVSAARVYRLAISGHSLLHVGDDGGLFERPVERSEIVIAPSALRTRWPSFARSRAPPKSLRSVALRTPVLPLFPRDWATFAQGGVSA